MQLLNKMLFCVCWGAGVDSTAMLIRMIKLGLRPAMITFADVGAEKTGTYEFIPIFTEFLVAHGFPAPVVCVYQPQPETAAKYLQAVVQVAKSLKIKLSKIQLDRLSRIYGNMVGNFTMPSITFGGKACSVKWKLQAQEPM